MKFDPEILVYIGFVALIFLSNYLKKNRQRQEAKRKQQPQVASQPSAQNSASAELSELNRWLETLWGGESSKPQAQTSGKLAHKQPPEKNRPAPRARSLIADSDIHLLERGKKPVQAARFRTRDDLRRAIIARVVLGPPRGLD